MIRAVAQAYKPGREVSRTPDKDLLSMLRAMNPDDPKDDLVSAAKFVPQPGRYTSWWDKNRNEVVDSSDEFTSIDHVLLSPELASRVQTVAIPHEHDPSKVTDHYPLVVWLRMGGQAASGVRITALLPNPEGDERANEQATLCNTGSTSVDLHGWKLTNKSGKSWLLDELGVLCPGEEKTITRHGQPMSLRNGGDTIDLVDPSGHVVQSVTYSSAEEGEVITP